MSTSKYEYQSKFARLYYGQGKADGLAEGLARFVLTVLTFRYGSLSPAVTARVQGASIYDLEEIAQRVLTAQTLDEALGTR